MAAPGGVEDVELVGLRQGGNALHLVVRGDAGEVALVVAMPADTALSLRHLYGPATPRCPVPPDAHVDLLLRCLLAADATARVVVRRQGSPAFRLRVDAPAGPVDLDLGVVDAVRLLTSGHFPVLLEAPGPGTDWDTALRALIDPPAP